MGRRFQSAIDIPKYRARNTLQRIRLSQGLRRSYTPAFVLASISLPADRARSDLLAAKATITCVTRLVNVPRQDCTATAAGPHRLNHIANVFVESPWNPGALMCVGAAIPFATQRRPVERSLRVCRDRAPPMGASFGCTPGCLRERSSVPRYPTTRMRPKTIAAMPSPSRKLIGSSNSHPPSIGVIARASATKG